jgi:hypothetical protein
MSSKFDGKSAAYCRGWNVANANGWSGMWTELSRAIFDILLEMSAADRDEFHLGFAASVRNIEAYQAQRRDKALDEMVAAQERLGLYAAVPPDTCPLCEGGTLVEFKKRRRVTLNGKPSWVRLFRSRCPACECVLTTSEQRDRNLALLVKYDGRVRNSKGGQR